MWWPHPATTTGPPSSPRAADGLGRHRFRARRAPGDVCHARDAARRRRRGGSERVAANSPPKPVPVPDEYSEGFWEAAAAHVLAIQRCQTCRFYSYPPVTLCQSCLSQDRAFRFEPVSGRATIRTWTVMRQAFLPGFQGDIPYVVAEVELEE